MSKKSLLPLLFLSFMTHAEPYWHEGLQHIDWTMGEETSASSFNVDNKTLFGVNIYYEEDTGTPTLYFMIGITEENKLTLCDIDRLKIEEDGIFFLGTQAIKAKVVCLTKDSGGYVIGAIPSTESGRNYVINAFKRKNGYVEIRYLTLSQIVSAKGFTKSWKKWSKKAL